MHPAQDCGVRPPASTVDRPPTQRETGNTSGHGAAMSEARPARCGTPAAPAMRTAKALPACGISPERTRSNALSKANQWTPRSDSSAPGWAVSPLADRGDEHMLTVVGERVGAMHNADLGPAAGCRPVVRAPLAEAGLSWHRVPSLPPIDRVELTVCGCRRSSMSVLPSSASGWSASDGVELRAFLDLYLEALMCGQASVFVGAGLSVPAGYVDWRMLLKPLAEDVGLDVNKEHDLIRVTQFAINNAGGRARVNRRIISEFSRRATMQPAHEILARLPIVTYWTTNFDSLIEEALQSAGRR